MKVEQSAIKKYKLNVFFHKKSYTFQYGVDVVMDDGKSYHVLENGKPLWFIEKKHAISRIKKLNKELREPICPTK